jgi:hypothetical protein
MFMILLVVFVPAFSLIFSPAYMPQRCECPECPECPVCPSCPPVAGAIQIFGHCANAEIFAYCEFYLVLDKIDNYKYVVVIPIRYEVFLWCEAVNFDALELWWFDHKRLNATHTYVEIAESVRNTFFYYMDPRVSWRELYAGRYITIYVMREDVDPATVLS